jgi:pSer/pThr/pTyr-binding forkhead associated (FHA) protein
MNQAIDRRELLFKAMAGLAGGVIGWVPIEIVNHGHKLGEPETMLMVVAETLTTALLGALIGGLILAAEGKTFEVTPQAKLRFWRGFGICFVLAAIASMIANHVFADLLTYAGINQNGAASIAFLILARATAWTLIGLMLGAGVGLATFSVENTVKGAIGGAIGGFIGGILFDAIGAMSQTGMISRFVGFAAIGLAIGLLIGLVQELTKAAWLAVEAGRLRGRQFRLEGSTAMIGRAEENPIGLFGDPGVQPRHARIERRGKNFTLRNLAVAQGTTINGNRVETAELHDGDRIKISNYELVFHERAGAQPSRQQARVTSPSISPPAPEPVWPISSSGPPPFAAAVTPPYLQSSDGQRYPIHGGAVTRLGRALDNDVVINHASVSRHHAQIEGNGSGYRLRDLGSQNGSFVDGQPITEAPVANGATLKLGDAVLKFCG